MRELFRQTDFPVEEMIRALEVGDGSTASFPPCLLMNELGVEVVLRRDKVAETYLREKMLSGRRGAEGLFYALCYLMRAPALELETVAILDQVRRDPDPEVRALVARAMAAIG